MIFNIQGQNNTKVNYRKRGFSLLELVLAIAIFSLGSVAIATLLIDSNLTTKLSLEHTEALLYAKEGVDAVRSIRDNSWSDLTAGVHGIDNSTDVWVFSGSTDVVDDKYTRSITVETVSTSTKNILVDIEWSLTSVRTAGVDLTTVLTDWREN